MAITTKEYKQYFLTSVEASYVRDELESMVENPLYNTKSSYAPQQANITFVDKHVNYLSEHPKLKPSEYLSNLRLMTKQRQ